MMLYLRDRTDFFTQTHQVLEISPRYLVQKKFQSMKNLTYLSGDLFDPLAMVRLDVTSLPVKTASCDYILCYSVFETVPDDIGGMKEIFRALKPGGSAIIHVYVDWSRDETFEDAAVTSPEDREKTFGGRFNCRVYGADYPRRLEAAGLRVQCIDFVSVFSAGEIARYGLTNVRYIFLCSKPEGQNLRGEA
jgi:SAM-dependent methyltransferase